MANVVKLGLVAALVGGGLQGLLSMSAWMDDNSFEQTVLQTLGDNMTTRQIEGDILANAQRAGVPVAAEGIKVTRECGSGSGPKNVSGRLGPAISVTQSCTLTATVTYKRKVGMLTKPVQIVQSK